MEVPFVEAPHLEGCKTLFELSRLLPEETLVSALNLTRNSNGKFLRGNFDAMYDAIKTEHMDPLYEQYWNRSDFPLQDMLSVLKGTITILEEKSLESEYPGFTIDPNSSNTFFFQSAQ